MADCGLKASTDSMYVMSGLLRMSLTEITLKTAEERKKKMNICVRIETLVYHDRCYVLDLGFQADLTNGKCKQLCSCFVLTTEWN